MKRIFKMGAIASSLAVILAISVSSLTMAAGPNPNPGTFPNSDSINVCPNPDCSFDGNQLRYQHKNGLQNTQGNAFRCQYRSCQIEISE